MSSDAVDTVGIIEAALVPRLEAHQVRPFVMGLCGSQGSGKSTAAAALAGRLVARNYRVAILSLDDLYLPREERETLGRTIHPLLRVRGVPGTHDAALGAAILDRLGTAETTAIPRFDKANDTVAPPSGWDHFDGPADIVLFEGWCVGAAAQPDDLLVEPINALEREQDPGGLWRRYVNDALGGRYRDLFAKLDMLVFLAAPAFAIVTHWRNQQEEALRARLLAAGQPTDGLMGFEQIARFVQYYERLTRHILAEMPRRADLTIHLDEQRHPVAWDLRPGDARPA